MIQLGNTLISEDVLEKNFVCNLDKCKGECCKAGDTGAPLDEDEIPVMEKHLEAVMPYLPLASQKKFAKRVFGNKMMITNW